ncbi:MAG: post-PEP-CTERM-1 domain-containing protein [Thermoanaerobaculia bacterium]
MLKSAWRVPFLWMFLMCVAAGSLSAQVYHAPETDADAGKAGMVVAIDAVTGELRQPTAKEAAALRAAAPPAARELKITRTSSGMVMIELDESFLDYYTVRIGDDGRLHTACVGADEVDTILRLPVRATPLMEEK